MTKKTQVSVANDAEDYRDVVVCINDRVPPEVLAEFERVHPEAMALLQPDA